MAIAQYYPLAMALLQLLLPGATASLFPDCASGPLTATGVCDQSLSTSARAEALVALLTTEEKIANTVNTAPGVPRLGLPAYQWWSEALHGVAASPGVAFQSSGEFSYATSFPSPILLGASFDDQLVFDAATIISTEARAFSNHNFSGLDYFTPNINPFKDPRWGRGQETPGEDPFHLQSYVYSLITGLEGTSANFTYKKIVATCKHFAAYDLEDWGNVTRHTFNALVSTQDLAEYYLAPFEACTREAKVGAVMCSYNAVNGFASCGDPYLLQTVLREHWNWTAPENWVTGDCGAVQDIYDTHNLTSTPEQAAALALNAGTDVDCGDFYARHLGAALEQGLITNATLDQALVRLYSSLVGLGYFDPADEQPYRALGWADVGTPGAEELAYNAAVEGIVLLKNDGTLPLSGRNISIALIGPWANATHQMQGNYAGVAPFLHSPLWAAQQLGFGVNYALGTGVSTNDTSGFSAALAAASIADAVIFAGGIDNTVEAESRDRNTIVWPGNQLDLIQQLASIGKPLVVVQFGGGQVDDTPLVNNPNVSAIIWAGYPGQDGGTALMDIIAGKQAPAGRLPVTQYPADYVNEVAMTNMALRPGADNPGRTYKWYTGTPVFAFGHGLHYTTFSKTLAAPAKSFDISSQKAPTDTFATFTAEIKNTGNVTSDYVALAFLSTTDAGPSPFPKKELVAYQRLKGIAPAASATASFDLTASSLARVDENGNSRLYPGTYVLALDQDEEVTVEFELAGETRLLEEWPQP